MNSDGIAAEVYHDRTIEIILDSNGRFDALPFIITALVLVIASMRKNKGAHIPAHLGENYFREER